MPEHISLPRKILIHLATAMFLPVASTIEGIAVLYALVKPVKTFDVVKK